jgi:hypothetical protein
VDQPKHFSHIAAFYDDIMVDHILDDDDAAFDEAKRLRDCYTIEGGIR